MHFRRFIAGISSVLFPNVCTICGSTLSTNSNMVCSQCLKKQFEKADNERVDFKDLILMPEGIVFKHALWNFDKGGKLQNVLHDLKYRGLTGIGIDVGRELGKSLLSDKRFLPLVNDKRVRLIPVPLHPKKFRKRGYNQAFYIAKGVFEVTRLPIIARDAVSRIKNTETQTGFTIIKRQKNMSGAFCLNNPKAIDNTVCILIDDVFTTGATTFELASMMYGAGSGSIVIATIAQA